MNALLFPGQGSQVVGMGLEFYNQFDLVKKIFKRADERLNLPITKIILEGTEDRLQLTENKQPSILTVSYSIFSVLKKEFNFNFQLFNFFAGHSLGEYSALVCANAIDFDDAIYLLHERGKAMQEAVPIGKGSMIAILGTKIDNITEILKNFKKKGICEIANDNADGQVIVSGEREAVKSFQEHLKEKNIKYIPLKVSAPFHCSLMRSAAENMREKINKTKFNKPLFKIVSNVIAKPEIEPENLKELLINQIFSTVKWRESIIYMKKADVSNFIEIGPGKVLSGMVKRTVKDVNIFSINSIADIKNLNVKLTK